MKERLIFWLPSYPDVLRSFLLALREQTEYDIVIACLNPILEERKAIYQNDDLAQIFDIKIREPEESVEAFFGRVLPTKEEHVSVFGGLLGQVGQALSLYQAAGYRNAIIISEKASQVPVKRFNWVIKRLKKVHTQMVYRKAYKKNASAIGAIAVTSMKGVKQFHSFGIPKSKLFNFMYTHLEPQPFASVRRSFDGTVKFLYIGRFDSLSRGIDVLQYAFDKTKYTNWSLDLVGGYGHDVDAILNWADHHERVHFIGSWDGAKVIEKMQEYDICISPTKIDGWRIQVNQAILAGIGTITTNEAGSDELVRASNTGRVVHAFRKKQLLAAVEQVLQTPTVVEQWKDNTVHYSQYISNEVVAAYFVKIINYVTDKGEKPNCPWLQVKN